MKYVVKMSELWVKDVIVEALNPQDAQEKVYNIAAAGEIEGPAGEDGFCEEIRFKCVGEAKEVDIKHLEDVTNRQNPIGGF